MSRLIAVDGASNAGKSTLVAELAARRGWQVLPDAGDLVRLFPPAPATAEAARANERYCLLVEEARSALLDTGWRTDRPCLLDRSALSTLAIGYGYAARHDADESDGTRGFVGYAGAMAASLRSGRLRLPDMHLYLRADPAVAAARNRTRPEPLAASWLTTELLSRQDLFYSTWIDLLPDSAGAIVDADDMSPAEVRAAVEVALDRLEPDPGRMVGEGRVAAADPAGLVELLVERLTGHSIAVTERATRPSLREPVAGR